MIITYAVCNSGAGKNPKKNVVNMVFISSKFFFTFNFSLIVKNPLPRYIYDFIAVNKGSHYSVQCLSMYIYDA